ncbi:MAG: L-threonylcarbamoyladenylate synthase [Rubricella sp.]
MNDREDTRLLPPDERGVAEAAALLRHGRLVAFPTETVYGLGADATNGRAVAAIYDAKNRPRFNPLIVHVPDTAAAERLAVLSPAARSLAEAFWPGPLTLVLPVREDSGLSDLIRAGHSTVAIRVPANPLARALLRSVDRPIAAPSANPSGRLSPTTAQHVLDGLSGRIAAVLDDGACPVGVESTILKPVDGAVHLLREGGLPAEAVKAMPGMRLIRPGQGADAPEAPGMLVSHYAPRAALRLNAPAPEKGEAWLGFGPGPEGENLSRSGDLIEAAANLFSALHALDAGGPKRIAVAPIPETGLGRAINDRLRRAAAPRSG